MNPLPPEKLLPKDAIADRLGVKPRTVWVWYRRGKIAGVRVGGRLRFYWSAVERAMVKKGGA
jgi:excisionase family DNA binding protein